MTERLYDMLDLPDPEQIFICTLESTCPKCKGVGYNEYDMNVIDCECDGGTLLEPYYLDENQFKSIKRILDTITGITAYTQR